MRSLFILATSLNCLGHYLFFHKPLGNRWACLEKVALKKGDTQKRLLYEFHKNLIANTASLVKKVNKWFN